MKKSQKTQPQPDWINSETYKEIVTDYRVLHAFLAGVGERSKPFYEVLRDLFENTVDGYYHKFRRHQEQQSKQSKKRGRR
jgi:hypothetical protein